MSGPDLEDKHAPTALLVTAVLICCLAMLGAEQFFQYRRAKNQLEQRAKAADEVAARFADLPEEPGEFDRQYTALIQELIKARAAIPASPEVEVFASELRLFAKSFNVSAGYRQEQVLSAAGDGYAKITMPMTFKGRKLDLEKMFKARDRLVRLVQWQNPQFADNALTVQANIFSVPARPEPVYPQYCQPLSSKILLPPWRGQITKLNQDYSQKCAELKKADNWVKRDILFKSKSEELASLQTLAAELRQK